MDGKDERKRVHVRYLPRKMFPRREVGHLCTPGIRGGWTVQPSLRVSVCPGNTPQLREPEDSCQSLPRLFAGEDEEVSEVTE